MEMSASIAELAKALCKVQAQLEGAKKDSENPFFKSNYADLQSVWNAIKIPLSQNGLSVTQGFKEDDKALVIQSLLMHESGEWIRSSLRMPITKNDPQTIGSTASYGRRYSLAALIGVYQSDDDAESAMPRKQPKMAQTHDDDGIMF